MVTKAKAAIVGSGNIGTDLLYKLVRSPVLEPRWMVGIEPDSEGLRRAAGLGLAVNADGVEWLLAQGDRPDIVFEATSAAVHARHAARYSEADIRAIDLTPAGLGPYVVPPINLDRHRDAPNLNMTSCGGQATIPIVSAVSRVVDVEYAEIVASVASASAGPGTRANIDEFTRTTARGVEEVGGAQRGKAIIILNPADPPVLMRDTVFCALPAGASETAVAASIDEMVRRVQEYAPGYRLVSQPQFDDGRVVVFLEVEGAGDYLPRYAGNLDIMTAAAVRVGEEVARSMERVPA
jgi:acetaldehyde dehydrogenase